MSQMNFEKRFGQSAAFVTSTIMEEGGVPPSSSPAALLKEAIHVISCGYEDKTDWGLEVKALNEIIDFAKLPAFLQPVMNCNVCSVGAALNAAGVDLRVDHGGHPDGVQDALPRVALGVLHAEAGGVQGVGADQSIRPSQPGAPVGAGVRRDLLQPPQPTAVRLQERQPQVAGALRLHQHHHLPFHLAAAARLLYPPRRLPPHRQVHHAVGQCHRLLPRPCLNSRPNHWFKCCP